MFRVRDSFYTSTSICGFVIGLHKGWFRFTLIDNILLEYNTFIANNLVVDGSAIYYFSDDDSDTGNPNEGSTNVSSPLGQYTDSETNSVNEEGSVNGSETAEELTERFRDNPEGLTNYRQEKENEISQKFVTEAREWWNMHEPGEIQDILQNLRDERDEKIAKVREKCFTALEAMEDEETYSDWTTDRGNSPAPNSPSSDQNTANQAEGSSSSNINTANQESSSTSPTESRFKQDSSDIMPDTEPMDFDDPTG